MIIYLLNLFIIFILLILSKKVKVKKDIIREKGMIFLALFIIICVSGLRYNVGTDFMMYESFFHNAPNFLWFEKNLEFFFILFAKISYFLNPNSSVLMFLFISIFIYYNIFKVAIKNCENYELAIYLFITFGFFTSSLNGLRQWMAIPLIYVSLDHLSKKENKKFILYLFISYLCHKSSILMLPFLICVKYIKKDSIRFILIIISIILYLNYSMINNIILSLISNFSFFHKYIKYLTTYEYIDTSIFVMPMFSLVTYILYYLFAKNKNINNTQNNEFQIYMINMLIFGFMSALLGTKIHYFERIQNYFLLSLIYVIPYIYTKVKKDLKKIIYIFCILMGLLFYIYSLNQNGANPLPYRTIFNPNQKISMKR